MNHQIFERILRCLEFRTACLFEYQFTLSPSVELSDVLAPALNLWNAFLEVAEPVRKECLFTEIERRPTLF